MPQDIAAILEALGLLELDEDIFTMSEYKLRKYFKYPTSGAINCSLLIKNLIWQDYNKLQNGELDPVRGNLRRYWYTRLKPVLARCGEKYTKDNKYDSMSSQFVGMVVRLRLFSYADFGFRDEGSPNRSIGRDNRHIICAAEKVGHLEFLDQLRLDYEVTTIALGGQPSAMSSEYFLRELTESGFEPDGPTPLFLLVDYDPSGYSIGKSFMWQLQALGFPGELDPIELFHHTRMTYDQIKLNKFHLPDESEKTRKWVARTGGLSMYHDRWTFFGLEADAMSWSDLMQVFDMEVRPYLKVPRDQIVRRRLKRELVDVTKEVLFQRLFG